jgi:alkylation response protein AidB-like acyl-CoA dehydrogenase
MKGMLRASGPGPVPAADDLAEFRRRVRGVVADFSSQAPKWESAGHLPRELFEALGETGAFSRRWRLGAVAGLPYARALVEELVILNGGAALAVSLHSELFVHALQRFGGENHSDVLRQALAGAVIGCTAITESHGGSDVAAIRTKAVPVERGWHLVGAKRYTTNVGVADNVLVLAGTGSGGPSYTLFRVPLDHPGVRVTGFFSTLGMRAADTGAIELDAVLSGDHVVGRPGGGMQQVLKILDFERIAATAGLVAGARHALRLGRAYMRTRTQFAKRLYDHQALRHAFAERWADVEAAAALLDAACAAGRGNQLEHHLVAAAKLVAARNCADAVDHVLQVLGGRGYTDAYPVERYYRDIRLTRIGGGTDEMMREIISTTLDITDPEISAVLASLADDDVPR